MLDIQDVSYSGTVASYFWLPATFGMDTIQKGIVYVKDGIKKKYNIPRVNYAKALQPRQATPTPNASGWTIDGRVLDPQDHMVYTEFNPRDFEEHWYAEQLSNTLLARELPVTAENFMLQIALARVFESIEGELWMGSTTYTATPGDEGNGQLVFMDGFLKKMVNDPAVNFATSPLPLTAAATGGGFKNIGEAMNDQLKQVASVKKALLSKPSRYDRMKFIVSINSEQIFQDWLTTTLTFKGQNTTERAINTYKGYEIVPVAGFPDNTILFCEAVPDTTSTLYVGMNSTDDEQLQLMRLQNNSELYFIKGLFKVDVQYSWSDQVFLYTTLTAASFTA